MLALTQELSKFGEFKIFRPHRDVRFSTDKSPYKTSQGAVTEGEGGEFYYLQINADGLMVASGYYQMATDQLSRFRAAVDRGAEPAQLVGRHLVVAARHVQTVRIDLDVEELPALALGDRPLAGLVRALVGAEPHIPVGTEDLELPELRQLMGQRKHRAAHGRLVDIAVGVPELPRVVHGELLIELDRGCREPFERGTVTSSVTR